MSLFLPLSFDSKREGEYQKNRKKAGFCIVVPPFSLLSTKIQSNSATVRDIHPSIHPHILSLSLPLSLSLLTASTPH